MDTGVLDFFKGDIYFGRIFTDFIELKIILNSTYKTMCEVLWRNISDFYVNLRVEVGKHQYAVQKASVDVNISYY
jgi:hypothetical protein